MARTITSQKRRKGSLILRLAICFFAAYLIFMLIDTQIKLSQTKDDVAQIESEIQLTLSEINELERISTAETNDEYMERIAREQLGYISGDERVFMDINANQ